MSPHRFGSVDRSKLPAETYHSEYLSLRQHQEGGRLLLFDLESQVEERPASRRPRRTHMPRIHSAPVLGPLRLPMSSIKINGHATVLVLRSMKLSGRYDPCTGHLRWPCTAWPAQRRCFRGSHGH